MLDVMTSPKKPPDPLPPVFTDEGPSLYAEAGREGGRAAQRFALLVALRATDWNVARASRALKMSRSALHAAMLDLIPGEAQVARDTGRLSKGRPPDGDE